MYYSFSFCLPVAWQSSPLCDESYFLLFPHTDSWCVLFTSNTSQLRPALCIDRRHWKKAYFSGSCCYEYVCNSLLCFISNAIASFSPNESNNAAMRKLFRVHKIQLIRDEKLDMIVQMSRCPPRGIAMYTELVVGFNCDIYEMWESNIFSPFFLSPVPKLPRGFFFPWVWIVHNCGYNWWIDLSGSIFQSCKLVSLEAVRLAMRRLQYVFAQCNATLCCHSFPWCL